MTVPVEHMFPNLTSLRWGAHGLPWLSYVRLFLSPRLEFVSLGIISTPAHLALLPTLPARCPLLKVVTIFTEPGLTLRLRPLSIMICGLMNLERLDVGSMDQSAFQHLAQLPTLVSLAIQSEPEFIPPSPTPNSPAFQRLRELALRGVSPQFLARLIAMNNWSLVQLKVNLTSQPTTEETAHIYSLLAAKCDPTTLTQLTIDGVSSAPALPLHQLAGAAITFDMLRPLFCVRALSNINLAPPAGFDLDDAAVDALAQAWPRVQFLQLGRSVYRDPAPRVTLLGLRALARHCPQLEHLRLAFDASVMPEDGHATLPAAEKGLSLRWFEVEDSVLMDPVRVAEYMFAVFPNLFEILTPDAYDVSEEMEDRVLELKALWREVLRLHASKRTALRNA